MVTTGFPPTTPRWVLVPLSPSPPQAATIARLAAPRAIVAIALFNGFLPCQELDSFGEARRPAASAYFLALPLRRRTVRPAFPASALPHAPRDDSKSPWIARPCPYVAGWREGAQPLPDKPAT
jgi:hypothetical protein